MNKANMEPSLSQVLRMEEFSKAKLSDFQKRMYVKLRKIDTNLTDQRLLAKIITLTDPSNLSLFLNSYKNIFQEEIAAVKKVILIG